MVRHGASSDRVTAAARSDNYAIFIMPYTPPQINDVTFRALHATLNQVHSLSHSLFTWAARIEYSLGLTAIEIVVYWRAHGRALVTRQKIPLTDFDLTEFEHRCELIRQAYLQSLGGAG